MTSLHAETKSAFDFSFTAIDGSPMPLSQFEGQLVLVVNTASRCGFTGQYEGLQALWSDYKDRGLVVLGVPSNDFGEQETGSNAQIASFCEVNFNIDFPMTEKQQVKGRDAHPFYQWVSSEAGMMGKPKWNFHKYLIGPDGQLISWFSSLTKPQSTKLIKTIEAHLPHQQQKAS